VGVVTGATVAAVTLTIDPVAICLTTDAADVVIVLIESTPMAHLSNPE
jgi:hypothetical protein